VEAERVIQLGHDGSEIGQISTLTFNAKLADSEGKNTEDLSPRGCYYTKGATSKLELEAMEAVFENGQQKLKLWREVYDLLFPPKASGGQRVGGRSSNRDAFLAEVGGANSDMS
jgi:hypothetical protein